MYEIKSENVRAVILKKTIAKCQSFLNLICHFRRALNFHMHLHFVIWDIYDMKNNIEKSYYSNFGYSKWHTQGGMGCPTPSNETNLYIICSQFEIIPKYYISESSKANPMWISASLLVIVIDCVNFDFIVLNFWIS